jgi:hypothetical protein
VGATGAAGNGTAAPPPAQAADDTVKKLDAARDNLRETAKWVVTGTGGIVALIVGGSSFTGLGSFALDEGRLWLALGCLGLGCILSWLPFRQALAIIATDMTSLREIVANKSMTAARQRVDVLLENTYPPIYSTIEKLSAAYEEIQKERLRADADAATKKEQTEKLHKIRPYVASAMALALTAELRVRFERLIRTMTWTGPLIILCFLAFAWAANPGKEPAPFAHPRPFTVAFRPENAPEFALSGLPASCYNPSLNLVLLAENPEGGFSAVTVPSDKCPALRLDIDSSRTILNFGK